MPTTKEIQDALGKPELARLKEVKFGLRVSKVLGARVLVKLVQPETELDRLEKQGVLYIPETHKERNTPLPSTGIVVAVGDGCLRDSERGSYIPSTSDDPTILQPGDMIMFSKYSGNDLLLNQEEEYRIIPEAEILCVLEEVKGGD